MKNLSLLLILLLSQVYIQSFTGYFPRRSYSSSSDCSSEQQVDHSVWQRILYKLKIKINDLRRTSKDQDDMISKLKKTAKYHHKKIVKLNKKLYQLTKYLEYLQDKVSDCGNDQQYFIGSPR